MANLAARYAEACLRCAANPALYTRRELRQWLVGAFAMGWKAGESKDGRAEVERMFGSLFDGKPTRNGGYHDRRRK